MSRILVTGGCGYIGSHTIVDLIENGYDVICLDSLINASDEVLDGIENITGRRLENRRVDLTDRIAVERFFSASDQIDGYYSFCRPESRWRISRASDALFSQ